MKTTAESTQSGAKGNTLSKRQRLFLPVFLEVKTVSRACEVFGIDRKTFYVWMKQPAFVDELERLQAEQIGAAIAALKMNTTTAAEKLVGLLQSKDESIQLRACTGLLDFYLKAIEAAEIEKRLSEIEKNYQQAQ